MGSASSPQLLRRMNSGAVMRFALRSSEFTAAEAMAATSLTRSTVLGVCDDLVTAAWLEEIADSRAAGLTSKGRPARRYRLREGAGIVAGVDAGEHRFTVAVADLRGRVLAERIVVRSTVPPGVGDSDAERTAVAEGRRELAATLLDETVRAAGKEPADVLLAVFGVPAPVDSAGSSPRGDRDYWRTMNPGFGDVLPGVAVIVENDANLAAIAEQTHGGQAHLQNVATVLSGERLGAGVILDGRLLRGAHGGAGEMRFLDIVEGAGSPAGIAALARGWAQEAVAAGATTSLAALAAADVSAEDVFRAAREGDPLAEDIIARLGVRLARVAAVLASLLDVDRIVIAGAIAGAAEPVLAHARRVLEEEFQTPMPELVASSLGRDVVVLGAVEWALTCIREEPLAFTPRPRAL
jgi:predicted NBD/HSP70 family sugar kinase